MSQLQIARAVLVARNAIDKAVGSNVTARVQDLFLASNELNIPGGLLERSVLLPGHDMTLKTLLLDLVVFEAKLRIDIDVHEMLSVFALDASSRTSIHPSSDNLVQSHVNEFQKAYARQSCSNQEVSECRAIVESRVQTCLNIESAVYGSFETGFFDVKDVLLRQMYVQEMVSRDVCVERLSMLSESKFDFFKRYLPQLSDVPSSADAVVVKPMNVRVVAPIDAQKLIITYSAGVHRRSMVIDDRVPFLIVVAQDVREASAACCEPPKVVTQTLAEQDHAKLNRIVIIKAEYKYQNNVIDVTNRLQNITAVDRLILPVTDKHYLLQADPAAQASQLRDGRVLEIEFEVFSHRYRILVRQDEALIVMASSATVSRDRLLVLEAGKISRFALEDMKSAVAKRVIEDERTSSLQLTNDMINFKDKLAKSFGVGKAYYAVLSFGSVKQFFMGLIGQNDLKVIAIQQSLEHKTAVDAAVGLEKHGVIQNVFGTSDSPPMAIVTTTAPLSSALPSATQSSVQEPTLIRRASMFPQGPQTDIQTSVSNTPAASTSVTVLPVPVVPVTDEKIELIKTNPTDITVLEKARKMETFQSPIMRELLSWLDLIKITIGTRTITFGDMFCILLAQPFLMCMTLMWFMLLLANNNLRELIGAMYGLVRATSNFAFYVIADTSAILLIMFIYALFTSEPFAIWITSKIRQEYEEFLIVKRVRDSTLGRIGKNLARWFTAAASDVKERGASISTNLNTTNVGVQE